MLQFINEDRYSFDFKKYEGRYWTWKMLL
jgi:hypothetical protein